MKRKSYKWLVVFAGDISNKDAQRTHLLEFYEHLEVNNKRLIVRSGLDTEDMRKLGVKSQSRLLFRIQVAAHIIRERLLGRRYSIVYIRAAAEDVLVILISRLAGAKTILEVNGAYSEEARMFYHQASGLRRKLGSRIRFLVHSKWGSLAYGLADRIVTVTPQLKSYLLERYLLEQTGVASFSNGVNTDLFYPKDRVQCINQIGLVPKHRYIGFVGRLAPWQGLDTAITAFSMLHEYYPDLRFAVVGDGSMRATWAEKALAAGVGDKIAWFGSVNYQQIPAYIGSFTVGIACSNERTITKTKDSTLTTGLSPLKVYEYLACARTVIASRVSGLEFIEQEKVGLLFTPANPSDLAGKLQNLLDRSEAELKMMEHKARQLATSRFSWQSITQNIKSFAES